MKNTAVYQGLFLMAIGLYAEERSQKHEKTIIVQKESTPAVAEVTPELPSAPELDSIYKKLKIAPVFRTAIDGVTLSKSPRTLRIRMKSEELYREGEIAMEETWLSVLDQIGNALFETGEPKADLTFASNASSTEKNSLLIASQRGDWVLRYLNRKYRFRLDRGHYRIMGLGRNIDAETGRIVPMLEILIKPEGEE